MKISDAGLDIIREFEGCPLVAYLDAVGVWTIGYGHTKNVKKGQVITKTQAEHFLLSDVKTAENKVNKYQDRYKWNVNQYSALVSFAFNIGSIDQLTANGTRNNAQISEKILAYDKGKVNGKMVVLAGLSRRRKAEKALFDKKVDNSTPEGEKAENEANTTPQAENTQEGYKMPTLKRGAKGKAVKVWQVILDFQPDEVDGIFGAYTEQRTIEYQAMHNLKKDGIVGSKTWEAGFKSIWATV